ncbi:MAG: pyridoxal phosphate-dependent aminotransferase [Thermoplasmatota archaeon]
MPGIDSRSLPKGAVRNLKPYEEEGHGAINLSNNANLFGPNPALGKAVAKLAPADLWDYPSLTSERLRTSLASRLKVTPSQIVVGNGSNDLIDVTIRAFCEPGEAVAYHPPTFAMIGIFARTNDADPRPAPLTQKYELNVEGLLATNAKVTFVVSPNNPTGNSFAKRDILHVVESAKGLVVVDEAYVEFGGASLVSELPNHPNLVILRTFSKAYGLAGLRIGYIVANEHVAASAAKVRGPFRLNAVSDLAATLALEEETWLAEVVRHAKKQRGRLAELLAARKFRAFPTDANFVFAEVPPGLDGPTLGAALERRGVSIRDYGGDLARFVRVTAAPQPMLDTFANELDAVLKEGPR